MEVWILMKDWFPDINWQIDNFGKLLLMMVGITLVGVIIIWAVR